MGDEVPLQYESSVAAPVIFLLIVAFQLLSKWLQHLKKSGSKNSIEIQLSQEIKQLLKEASSLSEPSTFAQAAKLRRLAATKEKELTKYQDLQSKEMKMSYDLYGKVLFSSKVLTYLLLVFWFWRVPVAAVPQQLVQPFGKVLSWWSGSNIDDNVKVGVIPWLILSTRVSRLLSRVFQ